MIESSERWIDLGLGNVRVPRGEFRVESQYGAEYLPRVGLHEALEAIANWEGVREENLLVTTGASMGLVSAFATLRRGSTVLLPTPSYPPYRRMLSHFGSLTKRIRSLARRLMGGLSPSCRGCLH